MSKKAQSPGVRPKSDSFPPLYDSVPNESLDGNTDKVNGGEVSKGGSVFKTSRLPNYDEVPKEEQTSYYSNMSNQQAIYRDKMAAFAGDQGNGCGGEMKTSGEHYNYSSAFSDATWGDEFDDDFDDDFDEQPIKDSKVQEAQPTQNKPPPLPPRTYQTNANVSRVKTSSEKPYILPLKQDGHQLSHTHYFLIPSINENESSSHYKREKSQRTTATVKPFLVNTAFDNSDERSSAIDYQNITGLMSGDVIQRSLSNVSNSSSRSSAGSCGSVDSSPRHHYHQHRPGLSSPSKARPIQSQRKSKVEEERGSFMGSSPRDRIAIVQSRVIGVTDDECYTALSTTHWDVESAVKYLKVEQLFRLGVAPRAACHRLLETLDWNLELASSVIIDEVNGTKKGSKIESTV
ncbi:unnamed protein product [Lymnaea stagnalis]|uniref:Activated CDC42 kinase 1 n=1 Tax=Lymnaea stagnalis TaxID=6523 RepID=A0AAV2H1H4_LYMST